MKIDIEKLRKQAGIAKYTTGFTCWEGQLEKFAELVAITALAQQDDLSNASKSEQLLASHDHALRAEFQRMKAALAQQGEQQRQNRVTKASLKTAYACGWINAAQWADREDLTSDMDSPAYMKDMNDSLGELYAGAAPAAQPDLSALSPKTQERIREWLADGTFVERAIGVMQEQEKALMAYEKTAPAAQPLSEWEIRGVLAKLKCWHRLTKEEAAELVTIYAPAAQGCDYCNHPLFAGLKCKSCGREFARAAQPRGEDEGGAG